MCQTPSRGGLWHQSNFEVLDTKKPAGDAFFKLFFGELSSLHLLWLVITPTASRLVEIQKVPEKSVPKN